MSQLYRSKYFHPSEFLRCVPPCSIDDLSDKLLDTLDVLRSLCGFPLIVTSAYRSFDYELEHKRSGSSSHCKHVAVDLACQSSERRLQIVMNALRSGFRRIGISKTFIHLDLDSDKPECIWLYEDV